MSNNYLLGTSNYNIHTLINNRLFVSKSNGYNVKIPMNNNEKTTYRFLRNTTTTTTTATNATVTTVTVITNIIITTRIGAIATTTTTTTIAARNTVIHSVYETHIDRQATDILLVRHARTCRSIGEPNTNTEIVL